ncbi:MAG: hypothetical protein WCH03_01275 [Flavobacteriia bacterium]
MGWFRLAQQTVYRVWELADWHISTFFRLAQEMVSLSSTNGLSDVGISTLADWHISRFFRLAQEVVSLSSTNGLSGLGISTLADWHISTLTAGLLAVAREPGFGCRFKELKS